MIWEFVALGDKMQNQVDLGDKAALAFYRLFCMVLGN